MMEKENENANSISCIENVDDDAYLVYLTNGMNLYFPNRYSLRSLNIVYFELTPHKPTNYFKFYEPKPDDVVMDVGACEGLFSLFIKDKVRKLYLIELNKHMTKALKFTFKDEIKIGKVTIIEKALSNRKGKVNLTVPTKNTSAASFAIDRDKKYSNVDVIKANTDPRYHC